MAAMLSPSRYASEAFAADLDSLEQGDAREVIPSECMAAPAAGDAWTCCRLTRPQKCEFKLFDGEGNFMLSARKAGDDIAVSCYGETSAATSRRGAVLRRRGGGGGAEPLRYELRLCVGEVVVEHGSPVVAVMPRTHRIGESRVDVRGYAVAAAPPRGPHYTRDLSAVAVRPRAPPEATLALRSRLPAWDDRNQCLSLKFGRGRVKLSSSKNVLVYGADALPGGAAPPGLSADAALLQLGKRAKGEFALDFKAPLSPLQAFAVALCAFDSKAALRRRAFAR